MKCEDVRLVMDDVLDRQLDEASEAAVQVHLEECRACRDELEAVAALKRRVAGLPRSIDPERDLWPGIERRIVATRVVTPRFGRRALMAAAASVLLVSAVVTAYLVGRHQAASASYAPTPPPVATDVLSASFAGIGVHDYRATRQQLVNVIEAREKELSPATMDVILTNLRLIDEAMSEIAEALGKDPDNELLIKQLVSIYRQQINLLERAAILPSEA